jgi:hypothetical protein
VLPDLAGAGVFISGELEREKAVEVASDHGQRGVEVQVQRDATGEGVEVRPTVARRRICKGAPGGSFDRSVGADTR